MSPIDFRNATWEHVRGQVHAQRLAVLMAWRLHGPGTTREVAQRSHIDILSFRPRTTELLYLGFVVLDEGSEQHGHEGRYRALSDEEARALFEERAAAARENFHQTQLKLQA